MRKLAQLLFGIVIFLILPAAAEAKVQISVDLSTQTMDVQATNGESYSWPISSARAGYVTPRGVYSANSLQAMHYSKKYHNSPMPHSIFFHGGFAIHGTYETASLGRPASHGCVRISTAHAAKLYSLVRAEGAIIRISGSPPPSQPFASETHHHERHHYAQSANDLSPHVMSYAPARHHNDIERIFGVVLGE
jgi:lipoprotein-anchoring transpeptidase ErfK/SrfK